MPANEKQGNGHPSSEWTIKPSATAIDTGHCALGFRVAKTRQQVMPASRTMKLPWCYVLDLLLGLFVWIFGLFLDCLTTNWAQGV